VETNATETAVAVEMEEGGKRFEFCHDGSSSVPLWLTLALLASAMLGDCLWCILCGDIQWEAAQQSDLVMPGKILHLKARLNAKSYVFLINSHNIRLCCGGGLQLDCCLPSSYSTLACIAPEFLTLPPCFTGPVD
jgi:hypothetical protein